MHFVVSCCWVHALVWFLAIWLFYLDVVRRLLFFNFVGIIVSHTIFKLYNSWIQFFWAHWRLSIISHTFRLFDLAGLWLITLIILKRLITVMVTILTSFQINFLSITAWNLERRRGYQIYCSAQYWVFLFFKTLIIQSMTLPIERFYYNLSLVKSAFISTRRSVAHNKYLHIDNKQFLYIFGYCVGPSVHDLVVDAFRPELRDWELCCLSCNES